MLPNDILDDDDMLEEQEDADSQVHNNSLPTRAFVRTLRPDELGTTQVDVPIYALCSETGECLTLTPNRHAAFFFAKHNGVNASSVH